MHALIVGSISKGITVHGPYGNTAEAMISRDLCAPKGERTEIVPLTYLPGDDDLEQLTFALVAHVEALKAHDDYRYRGALIHVAHSLGLPLPPLPKEVK
jgi:hypothetical protein